MKMDNYQCASKNIFVSLIVCVAEVSIFICTKIGSTGGRGSQEEQDFVQQFLCSVLGSFRRAGNGTGDS